MFNNLKKTYSQKGYITIRNFFQKQLINNLNNEIKEAENVDKYFDKNNEIRRIERLFNKGKELNFVNQKILEILKNIFEEDYNIFKDKFNAKPPGGEGFFAHYDGVLFSWIKIIIKKMDGTNIQIIL
jgi:hypothetical protein